MLKKVIIGTVKRWRANACAVYNCIGSAGDIYSFLDNRSESDNFKYESGNYFKTREDAEKYKEMVILKQKLKDLALELNEGREINWQDYGQDKYHIYYDYCDKKFRVIVVHTLRNIGCIYCLDEHFLDKAIELIGENKLKELINSGI